MNPNPPSRCTCTIADNMGRPLPKDRINMLHRERCPFVVAGWAEYRERVKNGEDSSDVIHAMAARSART